jgi:hypothetical protein
LESSLIIGDHYFAFFFFSEQKSKTVALTPMKTRASAPDTKMPFFKILFILSALPIQINNITFFFRFSNPCTSDFALLCYSTLELDAAGLAQSPILKQSSGLQAEKLLLFCIKCAYLKRTE